MSNSLAFQLVVGVLAVLLPYCYTLVLPTVSKPGGGNPILPIDPSPGGKPISDPVYHHFFHNLTAEEQLGLMSLAIFYYDGDISLTPVPRESTSVIKAVSKPTRSIENLNIPKSVYAHLLNGNIPSEWQRAFTKWLKKEYKLKVKHFEQFKETQSFCLPGETDCPQLDNIGGTCCPFG